MSPAPFRLRLRLVAFAVGIGVTVAVAQALVVHFVIDATETQDVTERIEHYTLWSSILTGLVIVAVAAGLTAWAAARALRPVAVMARTAQEWSEHDLDRRFDLGAPVDELRALGQTLDGLLDRVAQTIRAEQRLTAELAHELRTPLAAIRASADLIAMRQDLDADLRGDVQSIIETCGAMADTVTGLLDLARAVQTPAESDTRALIDQALVGFTLGQFTVSIAEDAARIGVPLVLGVRALVPFIDNAATLASHVEVRATLAGRFVEIVVSDNGPGVAPDAAGRIFDPGFSTTGGAGLGLPLARRVAQSLGGDVVLVPRAAAGGAMFVLRLPARSV